MKRILTILFPFLLVFIACGQNSGVKQANSIEFKKLVENSSGTLLDVRTLGEFKNGHIKDAGYLNYYALDFRQKLLLLSKNQPIYLYCNTSYRSQKAALILVENGYKNVYNLEHGIMEWNQKNLPVIIEPDAKPDTENAMGIDEFNTLTNSEQLVFIDFYATWCTPCRKMMPMMDSLKTEYKDTIAVIKINADASKKLIKKLGLISVPHLALYRKGSILYSHDGLVDRQELEKIFHENKRKYADIHGVKK